MKILVLCLMLLISVQTSGNDDVIFPELTTATGKYKEGYLYFFCTRPDASGVLKGNYEALRVHIWRLKQLDPHRDIVVMACQFTSKEQHDQLIEDGAIITKVESLQTNMKASLKGWRDVNTKFLAWQLIGWEKLLYLDIDIYFMDSFVDIWQQSANHIVETPPAEFADKMDEEYHGVPLRDLYPYMLASCVDTGLFGHGLDPPDILNSGLFMLRPSLAHFNVLLNVANADVNSTLMMDQGVINYVYNRTGPLPWANFSDIYDIFPYRPWQKKGPDGLYKGTFFDEKFKAYHYKHWNGGLIKWDGYKQWYYKWAAYRDMMLAETKARHFLHPHDEMTGRVSVTFPPGGITLTDTRSYSNNVTIYAVVSQDLSNQPSAEQIKGGLDASNRPVPTLIQIGSSEGFKLNFNNFPADKNYKVYYVKHNKQSNKFSSIGAVQFSTANNLDEARLMKSASLTSFSALSLILAIFVYL